MNIESKIKQPLLLFDGVCNFCNSGVNFIIDHNSDKNIHFASLQSDLGQKLLKENNFPTENFNTLLFFNNDKLYVKSDAVIEISKLLDNPYKKIFYTKIFPKFIRNIVYDLIAKYRYKIFGKSDQCRLPSKELRERFL